MILQKATRRHKMNRLNFLKTLGLILAALTVSKHVSFAEEANRPNIVWIFADDHAYQAIGAYGGRFERFNLTPNIDSLARDGMIFNRAYVANSICAPSRATLLTGKHSHLNGKLNTRGGRTHDLHQYPRLIELAVYMTLTSRETHH